MLESDGYGEWAQRLSEENMFSRNDLNPATAMCHRHGDVAAFWGSTQTRQLPALADLQVFEVPDVQTLGEAQYVKAMKEVVKAMRLDGMLPSPPPPKATRKT